MLTFTRCQQAWQDFIKNNANTTDSRLPNYAEALKSRPLRAVGLILGSVLSVSFVLAAFGGPGNTTLRSALSTSGQYTSDDWSPPWDTSRSRKYQKQEALVSEEPEESEQNKKLLEPYFTYDAETGLEFPPDIQPAHLNKYKRANATFVALVRNEELEAIKLSMREVERAFNRKAGVSFQNNDAV